MPLRELNISNTNVTDLSPLKGMPLVELHINGCKKINDLRVLLTCKRLVTLVLPEHIKDIDFLKTLPDIHLIVYENEDGEIVDWVKEEKTIPKDQ